MKESRDGQMRGEVWQVGREGGGESKTQWRSYPTVTCHANICAFQDRECNDAIFSNFRAGFAIGKMKGYKR